MDARGGKGRPDLRAEYEALLDMANDGEPLRTRLRDAHHVRLVRSDEEGCAAAQLPRGVYGFTGSAGLAAPLFAARRYRNFEVHHRHDGQIAIVGFVTAADLAKLAGAGEAIEVTIYPDATEEATEIVAITYSRIAQHRQYTVRTAAGLAMHVLPDREPAEA
jgi:hypothetical protein